jgi:histidyl-tRNA synthetase
VKIKNMGTGEQELVACDKLLDRVSELL